MDEQDKTRTRKVSNPHIEIEAEKTGIYKVVFEKDTLLFYSKKYLLGKLEESTTKMKQIPKGSKIKVKRTIFNENGVNVSQSVDDMWFEWDNEEAYLKN